MGFAGLAEWGPGQLNHFATPWGSLPNGNANTEENTVKRRDGQRSMRTGCECLDPDVPLRLSCHVLLCCMTSKCHLSLQLF